MASTRTNAFVAIYVKMTKMTVDVTTRQQTELALSKRRESCLSMIMMTPFKSYLWFSTWKDYWLLQSRKITPRTPRPLSLLLLAEIEAPETPTPATSPAGRSALPPPASRSETLVVAAAVSCRPFLCSCGGTSGGFEWPQHGPTLLLQFMSK